MNNSFLVNRRSGGGAQFSRDPFNLVNKHSRKVRDSPIVVCNRADLTMLCSMQDISMTRSATLEEAWDTS